MGFQPYEGGKGSGKGCHNCGGAGHQAGECPSPKQCNCCGGVDHVKAECPHKDEKCSSCGFWGHTSNKCQRPDGNRSKGKGKGKGKDDFSSAPVMRDPQNAQCYACGGFGHAKSACPYASGNCDFCGKFGHTQAMCHAAGNGPSKQSAAPGIYVSSQDGFGGGQPVAQSNTKDGQCYACGGYGHSKAACPYSSGTCEFCGKLGHTQAMCHAAGNGPAKQAATPEGAQMPGARSCYACGEYGHSKSACPYASGTCDFCGKLGHTQAMCHAAGNGPSKQAAAQATNMGFQMPPPPIAAMAIVQNINAKHTSHSHAQCYACGGDGHAKSACPYASGTCDFCGKTGHTQAMCHAAGNGPAKQGTFPVKGGSLDGQCYACGEIGHSKASCPYSAGTCEFCGKIGHTQAMCHAAGNGPARGPSVASQDGDMFGPRAIMQNLGAKDQVRIDQARSNSQCYACGGFGHSKAACPYASGNCEFCGKLGHTQAMCHAAGGGPARS